MFRGFSIRTGIFFFALASALATTASVSAWREAPRIPKGQPPSVEICPGRVTIVGRQRYRLTKIQKTLLCGDPTVDAWKHVPMAQAKFHMTTFLQEEGYYAPEFSEDGDRLIVRLGKITKVTGWETHGDPPDIEMHQRRHVLGRVLTPKFLNELEKWTLGRLQSRGYPCPEVKSRADPDTGRVRIEIAPGPKQDVVSVVQEPILHMNEGVLRRFDAFEVGKPFNQNLLTLSSARIQTDGILQSTYFKTTCGEDGAHLEQKTFAGRPRIVSVGFGANTEGIVLVKGSWKHTRLEDNASLFEASGYASYKQQRLDVSSSLYPFRPESRWHLKPYGGIDHERESTFHFLSGTAGVAAAGGWDNQALGVRFSIGPNLNYVRTFRATIPGLTTGLTRFVSLQTRVDLMSHDFEYYLTRPRSGYSASFVLDLNNKNLLSDVTAQRFQLDGHVLYNLLGFDPPLVVFGLRGGLYGTFTHGDALTVAKLPPNYRFYLGGSPDIRGFSLHELPDDNGALSAAYLSFEVRLAEYLPGGFQPFGFIDAGILGDKALRFDLPVYYSPGLGLRWQSPLGMFRTTVSHGFKAGGNQAGTKDTHWQFYVGIGEEF